MEMSQGPQISRKPQGGQGVILSSRLYLTWGLILLVQQRLRGEVDPFARVCPRPCPEKQQVFSFDCLLMLCGTGQVSEMPWCLRLLLSRRRHRHATTVRGQR